MMKGIAAGPAPEFLIEYRRPSPAAAVLPMLSVGAGTVYTLVPIAANSATVVV